MKLNKDQPIVPTYLVEGNSAVGTHYIGLTKREHFAALALQGLCVSDHSKQLDNTNLVHKAIELADELLKQL